MSCLRYSEVPSNGGIETLTTCFDFEASTRWGSASPTDTLSMRAPQRFASDVEPFEPSNGGDFPR